MKNSRHYPVSYSKVSNLKEEKSNVQNEEHQSKEFRKSNTEKEKVSKT